MGDPGRHPDACNAPLLSAPFYALRGVTIVAGDRLAQGVGIQPKLLRQRGQGIGSMPGPSS
jgi:hypothetical protein